MLFLESRAADERPPAVVVQGAPYDAATSYRRGSAEAPAAVRSASDSIESFSPRTQRDLIDVDIADAGDIDLPGGLRPEDALDRIAAATEQHARNGSLVVTFGGDHSISVGTARGLRAVYPDLVHLVYDAHMDMREQYEGSEWSHACGTRHLSGAGATCVLGVRSGCREEWSDATKLLTGFAEDLVIPSAFRVAMAGMPLFISVDMDVLDPSILPGTGNPEPGGPTYKELRDSLLSLAGSRVVGIDFVEVAPPIDSSGLSPIVAAELARDCILGLLVP
ncbi:MAG TPA: agmatinase [Actinomycetota bacterium]|nr:agmatinase [Actinomycetota bacterium]